MNFKLLKAFRLFSVISFSFAFLLDFHGSFPLLFRIFFVWLFNKANQQSLAFQSLYKFRLSTTTSKSADDNEHHVCQYPCYCYFGITFVCVYMQGQNGIGIQQYPSITSYISIWNIKSFLSACYAIFGITRTLLNGTSRSSTSFMWYHLREMKRCMPITVLKNQCRVCV